MPGTPIAACVNSDLSAITLPLASRYMLRVAAAGAISRKSIAVSLPVLPSCRIMKPPPPMLPELGIATASAKPVATAASTALPPRRSTATPMSDASALSELTMPCSACTGWMITSSRS